MPVPVSLTANDSITCSSTRPSVSALMSRTLIRMMPPGGGEFHRVADQVGEDLLQAQRIAKKDPRESAIDIDEQLDALFRRLIDKDLHDPVEHLIEPEDPFLQLQLAGFDLGKIEDIVDDAEQGVGRILDDVQIPFDFRARRSPPWPGRLRR